ncbi:MAG TPA: D-alanyl-D-alanine carboxypeptidase family protein [Thermoanaerobaculia bacterium]|nr:D-alanyl-D-alanine carboxypeptidase family protein [Thermoanaerobaculia bacterium]
MKRFVWMFLAAAVVALPLFAQEGEEGGAAKGAQVDTTGKGYTAAYLIEPSSKRVLVSENADVMLPTASMAKMMTCLIAMEEIKAGRLKLDTPVTISAFVSHMGGSRIYAKQGQLFAMQTLLLATMVQSANDAATAIAEQIAGNEQNFAELMNARAKQLGMTHSIFYDPHGLPNSKDPKAIDQASAHDLAVVAMELMKYPLMAQYAKTPWAPFANGTFTSGLTNPNHLINPKKPEFYPYATGLKTGYSAPAGYCVTTSAEKGGMKLIAVVMGAKTASGPNSSFGIASRLFTSAFANNFMQPVVKKGAVVGQVAVNDGRAKTVPAVAGADVFALLKRGEEGSVKVGLVAPPVTAPVTAGQALGSVVATQNGQQIGKVPVLAGAAVEKQPWWKRFWPF